MQYATTLSSHTHNPAMDPWQALRLFNLYRLILSFGFCTVVLFDLNITFFGEVDAPLYRSASILYLIISFFFLLSSLLFRRYFEWQANSALFLDIILIVILIHASGGFISGLGILYIVIIAAHSLLIGGKLSLLYASIATISIFIEHSYSFFMLHNTTNMYTQVGLLGTVILATAVATNLLATRSRKNQMLMENQAHQLATSQQLNAHIISAMHAGVLVLDNFEQIRLMNIATQRLLQLQTKTPIKELKDLPLPFQDCYHQWQVHHDAQSHHMTPEFSEIRLSFHPLGKGLPTGVLIFIYDVGEETRQAQDLKLASLGHLTANIAHELRNPLGAASHAAQLLAESSTFNQDEMSLIKMIKQSCDRMNTVIQNVLSLSGRKPAKTQRIILIPWLKDFIRDLVVPSISHPTVKLECSQNNMDETLAINMDASQLTQILINLCENGLRYSLRKKGQATLTLRVQINDNNQAVYIDVIDEGEGIPPLSVQHIFEPFFTTENTGSGLGLYIAKELSQMNGTKLEYCPTLTGCQFRLIIPKEGGLQ